MHQLPAQVEAGLTTRRAPGVPAVACAFRRPAHNLRHVPRLTRCVRARDSSLGTSNASQALAEIEEILEALQPTVLGTMPPEADTETVMPDGGVWLEQIRQHGRTLADEMAKLRDEAAEKAAALAALQKDRAAERQELYETQQALRESLEQLDIFHDEAARAQVLRRQLMEATEALEALKAEIAEAEQRQEEELQRSYSRFTELEEALAMAEAQLREEQQYTRDQDAALITKLQSEVASLRGEVDNAAAALQAERRRATQLRDDALAADKAYKGAVEELERLRGQLGEVQSALSSQATQYEALTEELRSGAAEDLQAQLQAAQSAAAQAAREMDDFKTQLQEREAIVSALQAELEALRNARDGEAAQALESLQTQLKAAQAEAAAAEVEKQKLLTELSEWQDAVNDLESEVERQKRAAALLTTQLQQLEGGSGMAAAQEASGSDDGETVSTLKQQLADTQRRLEQATDKSERLQQEVRAKEEGLRSLKEQMEEQKVAVENLGQKSAANADQLGRLQSAVAKRDIELAESRDMLTNAERELAAAVKRAQELEVATDAARREHEAQADALSRELQDTRNALADLQGQLNANDRSLADEAARLRQELAAKDDELASNGTTVDALSEELSSTRGALAEAEARLERATGDAEAAREQAEAAQARVREVEDELSGLRGLRDQVAQQEESLSALQARLDERDTDVKRLYVELEAAQEREQSKLAELLEAGEAAELLSTELERLQASIAARDSEVEQWREEATAARRLAEEAAAAAEETAVLADEVLRLEAVLKEKDEALDEIDAALEEAESLRADAQQKIKGLKARVQQADMARAEADKARQTLDAEVTTLRTSSDALEREVRSLSEQLRIARAATASAGLDADGQSVASIDALRKQAAEEAKMAADLLAKAEAATTALGQQMAELLSQQERANTGSRGRAEGDDLSRLEAERLEASRRAESAEAEAELLRKQLELLAEDASVGEQDPMQTYNVKVLEELASAQSLATAAQTELTELRRQNRAFQQEIATLRKSSSNGAMVNGKVNGAKGKEDPRLVAALSRVEELERENEALQEAAAKRDLILAHSKKFIESYLQKSAALLDKNGQP